MQAADDVQFGDAEFQGFARFLHDLRGREFEAVGIAFLAREGAELARENAVIGIIDVAIDDVARAIAHFLLPHQIRDGSDRVQILRFKQPQSIGLGNAFARRDLIIKVAQLAALDEEIHQNTISRRRAFEQMRFGCGGEKARGNVKWRRSQTAVTTPVRLFRHELFAGEEQGKDGETD